MKLRSNFRDYYDSVLAHGQDDFPMYMRFSRIIEPGKYFVPFALGREGRYLYSHNYLQYDQRIIGFCGRLYPVFEMYRWVRVKGCLQRVSKFCYTVEEIDKWVQENYKEREYNWYLETSKKWDRKCKWEPTQRRVVFEKWFAEYEKCRDNYREIFEKENAPVFVTIEKGKEYTFEINPCLKDYEFFRVFDSYQVFQQISMFLGNMAEPRKPMPPISDDTMAEIKGFDKWSFRKPPKNDP